ncbi:hypothetical protein TraAM80_00327 [Trypanosoma rangeli]|uniref:Uncharacterized protein n=1 Tax=Trypanosoma rangeli TaxID=5698 RepID=A0A422P481_TRYRA|nr:uncharacterized protein TraAM80_00327 [Trypanosoma rangeli]RNF12474.1 hypothetical protein TraAM80_00327 [Trypanosoma rangeli]|eukprot:RNF12474.1 hypothetical protein TraAM80_00327 [Trypanosoma rangeli]
MVTIVEAIDFSTLQEKCRVDLLDSVVQLTRHGKTLPKKGVTVEAPNLPSCTFAATVSHSVKKQQSQDESTVQRYISEEEATRERELQAVSTTYFKKYHPKFEGALPRSEPFRDARDRNELVGREKDFVHRYAEAATKSSIEREVGDDVPTQCAIEAYTKAFRAYKGRNPTKKELDEVERLWFAVKGDGTVGVIQKKHFYGPHCHVSICNRRPAHCPNQVYKAELPPVRGARSRFPGPIPVWSSTQNTYTLVAGDTHVPGLHNVSKFGPATC